MRLNICLTFVVALVFPGCETVRTIHEAPRAILSGRPRGGEASEREGFRLLREAQVLPETKANLPRIIAAYQGSLRRLPDPTLELKVARLLALDGRPDESREALLSLREKFVTGQASIATNDPELALDVADLASGVGLGDLASETVVGFASGPIHQIDARFALPELDRVPAHAQANGIFAAGVGKLRIHQNAAAIPLFEEAARLRPDWGWARFMVGYANECAGRHEVAEPNYARAAKMGVRRPARMRRLAAGSAVHSRS